MLTKDDLSAIGSLIDEKIKPLKEGQEKLETRMGGLETQMERLERKLDQSIEDNAAFHNHAGTFFDEMKNKIEKRIETLEEVLLIPKN